MYSPRVQTQCENHRRYKPGERGGAAQRPDELMALVGGPDLRIRTGAVLRWNRSNFAQLRFHHTGLISDPTIEFFVACLSIGAIGGHALQWKRDVGNVRS